MLLFESRPPYVCWSLFRDRLFSHGACEVLGSDESWLDSVCDLADVDETIAFVLPTGPGIESPVSYLTPELLDRLEAHGQFLGDDAFRIILLVARQCLTSRADAVHLLFCESAFFSSLPPVASVYGLPYEWYEKGIRRYGGDGLCHQWAWEQVRGRLGGFGRRVLCIHLGDQPNVVALRDGKPLETSMGFAAEGIFSATGCGDLDPTIVLLLRSAGMAPEVIGRMLMQESGFTALVEQSCDFLDLMRDESPKGAQARDMLLYALLKAIGAGAAVLGGVDAVVLVGEHLREATDFIIELGHRLTFLGVACTDPHVQGTVWDFTGAGSWVRIVGVPYKRAESLLALASRFLEG